MFEVPRGDSSRQNALGSSEASLVDLAAEPFLIRHGDQRSRLSEGLTPDHNRMMLSYALSFAKPGQAPLQTLASQAMAGIRYLTPRLATCFLAKVTGSESLIRRVEDLLAFRPTDPSEPAEIQDSVMRQRLHEVRFRSAGGEQIYAWHFPAQGDKPTVVYVTGNHQRLGELEPIVKTFSYRGFGFFSFDYQGYGKSSGKPSQLGFSQNLEAAVDYLTCTHGIARSQMILIGNSLGSTVTVDVASRNDGYRGVALLSPLNSVKDAFIDRLNNYRLPRQLFDVSDRLSDCFPAKERIPSLRAPLLILHGDADSISPLPRAEELFEAATGTLKKVLLVMRGAGHADVFMRAHPRVFDELHKLCAL